MKKIESIEKDALTEMMSPSVSPSAARDAEIEKSVEMALQDFNPKNRIADSVVDEETVADPQIIEEPPTIQRRVSSKQRKLSLEEYRNAYLKVPVIIDRKPVFVSCEVRDRLEDYVRKLGGRKMVFQACLRTSPDSISIPTMPTLSSGENCNVGLHAVMPALPPNGSLEELHYGFSTVSKA